MHADELRRHFAHALSAFQHQADELERSWTDHAARDFFNRHLRPLLAQLVGVRHETHHQLECLGRVVVRLEAIAEAVRRLCVLSETVTGLVNVVSAELSSAHTQIEYALGVARSASTLAAEAAEILDSI